jgi:hypothetical protein
MKKQNLLGIFLLFVIVFFAASCNKMTKKYADIPQEYHILLDSALAKAGENKAELEKALINSPKEQKAGMAFLISYMPEVDLKSLSSDFLLENCEYAYKARNEFDWCKNLPDSIFFNEVLPYRNLNETADNWRKDFYNRFKKYVKDCKNATEAFEKVNANIINEVKVEYNTKRRKADQSPYESMEINMASCTGLSILLADALRSVGVPARVAGVPLWYDMSGNHNWTEVWFDNTWYYTEYGTKDKLDSLWFSIKAGKANPEVRERSIYAASYKPTSESFPLVWDTLNSLGWINGINVSQRYIDIAKKYIPAKEANADEIMVKVWILKDEKTGLTSDNRISENVAILDEKGAKIDEGTTANAAQDMNDCLYFILDKNKKYSAKYKVDGKEKTISFAPSETLLLY